MIVVESAGLLTTVQDLGRPGFGRSGVSPSGAADSVSLRIANLLAGNAPGEAALEMTVTGGQFRFTVDAVVAVVGGAMTPRAMEVRGGDVLAVRVAEAGARAYLAVRGGIDVPRVMGSASTHLTAAIGGFEGRALRRGDVLRIGPAEGGFEVREPRAGTLASLAPRKVLRITEGAQAAWFTEGAREALVETPYRVSPDSNRMGLRLAGVPLKAGGGREMITEGVPLGAIQVPANGQPIILFVEQQTTGGYPKIANVIAADMASVGQLRPGDQVRFERVSFAAARALFIKQERLLTPERLLV